MMAMVMMWATAAHGLLHAMFKSRGSTSQTTDAHMFKGFDGEFSE